MVDVTWGDKKKGPDHSYLNFGLDKAKKRYSWYDETLSFEIGVKTNPNYSHD